MQSASFKARLPAHIEAGLYEFVKKGDPPVMGLTKMHAGVTPADIRSMRTRLPADVKAGRIPATTPGELPTASTTAAASP